MDLCKAPHKSIYVEYEIMWSSVFTYTHYPPFLKGFSLFYYKFTGHNIRAYLKW